MLPKTNIWNQLVLNNLYVEYWITSPSNCKATYDAMSKEKKELKIAQAISN